MAEATLADLGEGELIRRLAAFAPPGQLDDDAALLPDGAEPDGRTTSLVLNTDVLVDGVHFSDATTGPEDVGWRAAAANLSDLAAMGCSQVVGITVGLVAPGTTTWAWVEGVYRGLGAALAASGGSLLGGDCSGGRQRVLAVSAVGRVAGGDVIRRGDGRPGDLLVATGPHGLSRLGLALLLKELEPAGLDRQLAARAIRAHQRPRPRFDAVAALIGCRPAGLPWRVGGCDSSDGLAAAAAAIGAASGCAARLDRGVLPLDPAMGGLAAAEAWCLGGGEDFELVLALPPAWALALVTALAGTTVVGALEAGIAGDLGWTSGEPWTCRATPNGGPGYRHFS
jgi:thiamine-monophosphate kinase